MHFLRFFFKKISVDRRIKLGIKTYVCNGDSGLRMTTESDRFWRHRNICLPLLSVPELYCRCILQLFRYTLKASQTCNVWPNDVSLSSFLASGFAGSIIPVIVSKVADGVRQLVSDVNNELLSEQQALTAAFDALQTSLTAFETKVDSLTRYVELLIQYN